MPECCASHGAHSPHCTRPELHSDLAAALDELERVRALLDRLVDNDACRFDHHGLCQSHSLDPQPCPSATAQALLRAFGVRRG